MPKGKGYSSYVKKTSGYKSKPKKSGKAGYSAYKKVKSKYK